MYIAKDKGCDYCVLYGSKPVRRNGHWESSKTTMCEGKCPDEIGALPSHLFPEQRWDDEPKEVVVSSFDGLVRKMCPSSHDGKGFGLLAEMFAAKLRLMEETPFKTIEEECGWMAEYLKGHWDEDTEKNTKQENI